MRGSSSTGGRVFFAAVPDAAAAAQIHRLAGLLKRAHKFDGKLIKPERLHISLFFLGDVLGSIVDVACAAAAEVRTRRFEVRFDRTASFRGKPGSRPFVLVGEAGLRQLESFRHMLGEALEQRGLKRLANTNFTPHVTLLYDARDVEEYPIEPISWTMTEFVLIHSLKGHIRLARWPLAYDGERGDGHDLGSRSSEAG